MINWDKINKRISVKKVILPLMMVILLLMIFIWGRIGYKAYDRDPINSAQDFDSYVDAINVVAEALSKNYLTETGSFFNGYTVEAVNQKYATDKSWHEKVFSYMELLYDKLG